VTPPLRIGPGAVTRARREGRLTGRHALVCSFLAGKMVKAGNRYVRRARPAVRAYRAARAQGIHKYAQAGDRTEYRGVYLVPAGPGAWHDLCDTIASIQTYEDDDVKIVVIDDWTLDVLASRVQARYPGIDVVRPNVPAIGGWRTFPAQADALGEIIARYRFEVLVKMDTDALITGPGLTARAAETFRERPRLGQLGAHQMLANGLPRDPFYERWVVTHSARWSRHVRRLVRAVEARGLDPLDSAQGGVYAVARRALDAAAERGLLRWRQPWWSLIAEDTATSLVIRAAGYDIGSWGGPGEPIATTSFSIPIALDRVLAEGKLGVHTVRAGLDGESEAEVRAFFRARREEYLQSEATTRS
jgi:hypothetical protein